MSSPASRIKLAYCYAKAMQNKTVAQFSCADKVIQQSDQQSDQHPRLLGIDNTGTELVADGTGTRMPASA